MEDFRTELNHLINKFSKESGSDTPDFILGGYIERCLEAFDRAVTARTAWYKESGGIVEDSGCRLSSSIEMLGL